MRHSTEGHNLIKAESVRNQWRQKRQEEERAAEEDGEEAGEEEHAEDDFGAQQVVQTKPSGMGRSKPKTSAQTTDVKNAT